MNPYQAKQGDIIWLLFHSRVGHEQQGRRPAVVVSNAIAHGFMSKRAVVCPISGTKKGYPFQPVLDDRTKTQGSVLCDQVTTLDLEARNATFIERIPDDILENVVDIIYGMVEMIDPQG